MDYMIFIRPVIVDALAMPNILRSEISVLLVYFGLGAARLHDNRQRVFNSLDVGSCVQTSSILVGVDGLAVRFADSCC